LADDYDQPAYLKVVSDNPNAQSDREAAWAKTRAVSALKDFTAALLRVMAGSDTEVTRLIHGHREFLDCLEKLSALNVSLTALDLESALRLRRSEYVDRESEYGHRRWLRERGFEVIVQGALRLAAHKLLEEEPHFGGKYSEEVIERGIKYLEELRQPPAAPRLSVRLPESKRRKESLVNKDAMPPLVSRQMPTPSNRSRARKARASDFDKDDLKALRKAIKDRDEKRIAELRAKLGKRPLEE
jgi:hypothetical protein